MWVIIQTELIETDRQTDRQTDRDTETNTQRDRQTDSQRQRDRDRDILVPCVKHAADFIANKSNSGSPRVIRLSMASSQKADTREVQSPAV